MAAIWFMGMLFTAGLLYEDWTKGQWTLDDYGMLGPAIVLWPLYLGILAAKLIAKVR